MYDENRWSSDSNVYPLAQSLNLSLTMIVRNLKVLDNLGYVRLAGSGSYMPTEFGTEAVQDYRMRTKLVNELDLIGSLNPQSRGREFQKLFAKVVGLYGWSCEESLRTPHEEIDVIVHKNREYYLVECKWVKKHIESAVVRELYGKIENRLSVRGILVSMSGFTSGAIKQVQDYTNARLIYLFGPGNFSTMLKGDMSFDQLLEEKHHQLVTRKVASFR
ncbi:MAG TPA: restriction endonuclease [Patescibacteria group bacterium]|nr:restriction endonuclease [Patescibacteria group bacterium]